MWAIGASRAAVTTLRELRGATRHPVRLSGLRPTPSAREGDVGGLHFAEIYQ